MPHSPTRRRLLLGLAASMVPTGRAAMRLSDGHQLSETNGLPLTIDVHTHVFNGSDLQIKEFIAQAVVGHEDAELYRLARVMGGVLQGLAWRSAPSARDEVRALEQYATRARQTPTGAPRITALPAYQDGYARGRQALQQAAATVEKTPEAAVLGPSAGLPGAGLGAAIRDLPPTFEEFEDTLQQPASVLGSQPHLQGYISFVLHHFNYRFVNAIDYLTTYAKDPSRRVDLMVASLVDYDWWLSKGRPPDTPLAQQVDVMRRITILLNGRIHGFVPFCPFRETMTSRGGADGDSMRLVKQAIGEAGFLGVKLYPPMGFAPWGNATLRVWQDKRSLPGAAADGAFGARLDTAMRRLFEWCQANDVPIMAHANHSNGPYDEFKALAGAEHWDRALARFPGLKVSFGHLGDTDIEDHDGERSRSYIGLMTAAPASRGAGVYADAGYFAGVLGRPGAVVDVLDRLMGDPQTSVLAGRLMYGSDWTMVLPQRNVENYLTEFVGVFREIDRRREGRQPGTVVSRAFFGGNAVEFLGLRRNSQARNRLEAFYSRQKMALPQWLEKVDSRLG